MSLFVLESDLLLVLGLVNRPMEGHQDWRAVADTDSPLRLRCGVRVFKVNRLERILFEIYLLTIDSDDVQVDHGTVTGQFVEL